MKTIKSSKGVEIYIDEEDFDIVNQYVWTIEKHGRTFRAKRPNCWTRREGWESKNAMLHRFILKAQKGQIIDHIDGNGLNNCRINLRFCTQSENARNSPARLNGNSGFLGVCWCSEQSKWVVQVHIDGKYKKVGRYEDKIEAALAYNVAASFSYGQFAKLNKL